MVDVHVVEAALRSIPRERALLVLAEAAGGRGLYEIREQPRLLKAVLNLALREADTAPGHCPRCGYPLK